MSVPAFSDIAKLPNDLLNRDFYHLSSTAIDVKSKAPNGVSFNVKGKSAHEGKNSGSIEAKYADPLSGIYLKSYRAVLSTASQKCNDVDFHALIMPGGATLLMLYRRAGLTLTQGWTTTNNLETKIELNDKIAQGLKAEALTNFVPSSQNFGAKLNLYFKQPNFHGRAFFDILNGPTANIDAVFGHEGFVVGAEAGYDVNKAAITRYSAAVGYSSPLYTAAVTSTNNLSIFAASYYHKVSSEVEAGAKATWDSMNSNAVGLELAGKYRLDPMSWTKVKVNDRGIAAVAYNVLIRPGVKVGFGLSVDTQNLKESAHKIGTSFEFEG